MNRTLSSSTSQPAPVVTDTPARELQQALADLKDRCRTASAQVAEPKAQALFETTAEVLTGLHTAFDHYLTAAEPAMVPVSDVGTPAGSAKSAPVVAENAVTGSNVPPPGATVTDGEGG